MINLDTNILIATIGGTLSRDEADILDTERWSISAIVLWELELLYGERKIGLGLDSKEMTQLLSGVRVWPISPRVCLAMRELDFRSDPADELIAATSIAHNVPLLTRDTRMLASELVPLALR